MNEKQIEARSRFWHRAFWWYVDEVAKKQLTRQDITEDCRMIDRIAEIFF